MARGSYNGGSTLIKPGSDWFGKEKIRLKDLGKGDLCRPTSPPTPLERQVAARLKAQVKEARRAAAMVTGDDAAKRKIIKEVVRAAEAARRVEANGKRPATSAPQGGQRKA